ncbi:hypothetical protein ACOSP7_012428 [Xanthoceras sorbifolium]
MEVRVFRGKKDIRKPGWKRRARSSVVIMEDVQDSVRLGKRDIVGGADALDYYSKKFKDLEECSQLIKQAWQYTRQDLHSVQWNIKQVVATLAWWYRSNRNGLNGDIKNLQNGLDLLTADDSVSSWMMVREV